MSKYTIIVKRGNFQYSVEGGNRDFAVSHIDMLFSQLKTRVPVSGDEIFSKLDVKKEAEKPKDIQPKPETPNEPENIFTPPEEAVEEPKLEQEEISTKELHVQSEICEEEEVEPDFAPIEEMREFHQEEPILDTEPNNFEAEAVQSEEQSDVTDKNIIEAESIASQDDSLVFSFENILEEKIKNPELVEEVLPEQESVAEEPETPDYDSFVKSLNAQGSEDYLVITAYYMLENEGLETFSLKQLNQKLFTSMKLLIDRKTIQNAVENGLVEIVSEFSNDGVTEYALTEQGRYRYINGFS